MILRGMRNHRKVFKIGDKVIVKGTGLGYDHSVFGSLRRHTYNIQGSRGTIVGKEKSLWIVRLGFEGKDVPAGKGYLDYWVRSKNMTKVLAS